jgi:hypothetical protein
MKVASSLTMGNASALFSVHWTPLNQHPLLNAARCIKCLFLANGAKVYDTVNRRRDVISDGYRLVFTFTACGIRALRCSRHRAFRCTS